MLVNTQIMYTHAQKAKVGIIYPFTRNFYSFSDINLLLNREDEN